MNIATLNKTTMKSELHTKYMFYKLCLQLYCTWT